MEGIKNRFKRAIVLVLVISMFGVFATTDAFASIPMNSTVTQANTADVNPGQTDREILRVNIMNNFGCAAETITSMQFTMQNTYNADVSNAKIYYTGTSSTFAATPPANCTTCTIANPTGTITFNFSQDIGTSSVYFWLAFDVASGANTCGGIVDAFVPDNGVDPQDFYTTSGGCFNEPAPPTPNPAGNRVIEEEA